MYPPPVLAAVLIQVVYLGLFVFSAVFALISFIFGHDTDSDTDHDVGHDLGGHELGEGMPSIFSSRVISLFLLGFSGMGLISTYAWDFGAGLSSLCGIGSGIVMGGLAYAMVAIFYREQASSIAESADYAGLEGRVSSNIPAGGTGEITVVVKGQLKTIFAGSADGSALPEGRPVKIVSMIGATASVKPI